MLSNGLLLLSLLSVVAAEPYCYTGVFLDDGSKTLCQPAISPSNFTNSHCSFTIDYQIEVDTCNVMYLKGTTGLLSQSKEEMGCRVEGSGNLKKILCYCAGDGCNGVGEGMKNNLDKYLGSLKSTLQLKPKKNAVLLYELECLMSYLDDSSSSASKTDSDAKNFFSDPLHVTFLVIGILVALMAMGGICYICILAKNNKKRSRNTSTSSVGSQTKTATSVPSNVETKITKTEETSSRRE